MVRGVLLGFVLSAASYAGTTVTYIYSDPQGTPLAEADSTGKITGVFDYAPYGLQVTGAAADGPGYTGHVSDPDTQLIYMQARYYDPVVGRFLSPDPVLPQPANTGNFNIYSYASNNPINFTDPNGMYVCQGSGKNCASFRDRIKKIDQASRRLPAGTGKDSLKAVVDAYGAEGGQGNVNGNSVNVTVTFANLGKGVYGETSVGEGGAITVTFNEGEMASRFPKSTFPIESAATAAHEGKHVIEFANGDVYGGFNGVLKSETWAYMTQSYVNEAFDVPSYFGVWQPRWRNTDAEHYRRVGALEAGTQQAFQLCPQRKCK